MPVPFQRVQKTFARLNQGHVEADGNKSIDPLLQRDRAIEEEALKILEEEPRAERCDFVWNHRSCTGVLFHRAVLDGDLETVQEMLEERPEFLSIRWVATAKFQGSTQLYSGTAMHLAVSRGGLDIVQVLIQANASPAELVTRAGKPNYDVLHAAAFAEGRGGKPGIIKYLLESGAELTPNQEKRYPLHIAFLTGAREVIHVLRAHREENGLPHIEEGEDSEDAAANQGDNEMPLELGIKSGSMSEEELAEVALLVPHTLATFLRADPHCAKCWIQRLERMEQDNEELPFRREDLVPFIPIEKLAEVIREAPMTATVLLKYMTKCPELQSKWHPMPRRLSFAPRTISQRLFQMLNPDHYMITFEEREQVWAFDSKEFTSPEWHQEFTRIQTGRPIKDVKWDVCLIPNLTQALIFQALMDVDDSEAFHALLSIKTVEAMVNQVWWSAAWRVDLLTTVLNAWGLGLLVADQIQLCRLEKALSADEELTRHLMAQDFIVSKAMLTLLHEALTFVAFVRMGRAHKFFTLWEIARILRELVSCFLLLDTSLYRTARAIVIIVYWGLVARLTYFSSSIAKAMLPIIKIVDGLIPSMTFVLIAFCAVAHAFMTFKSGEMDPGTCLLQVFDTLFTGDIFTGGVLSLHFAGDSAELKFMEVVLCCGAVLVFSVFFLNLFTGVMCLLYSESREAAKVNRRRALTRNCLHHLLRAEHMQVFKISKKLAWCLIAIGATPPLVIQFLGYTGRKAVPHSLAIYTLSMSLMLAGAHLCEASTAKSSDAMTTTNSTYAHVPSLHDSSIHSRPGHDRYLWIVQAKKIHKPSPEPADGEQSPTSADINRGASRRKHLMQPTSSTFGRVVSMPTIANNATGSLATGSFTGSIGTPSSRMGIV
mmetsp:Transcript_61097/g.137976  ORF Transcript_61097/g.137976 Transcript_61097/m.137976 type:complete len:883 (-) Transcript_61097:18-2666(-)